MDNGTPTPAKRLHWLAAAAVFVPLVGAALALPQLPKYRSNRPEELLVVKVDSAEYQAGQADARRDLTKGVLALEIYGVPVPGSEHYDLLLRQRYGIQLRLVATCSINQKTFDHATGYDGIMEPEIGRRFGTNIVQSIWSEDRLIPIQQ